MGRFSWWLAGIGNRTSYGRLLKATKMFRAFPFNSPSYQRKNVKAKIANGCVVAPALEYGKLVGIVDRDNINELIMIKGA